VSSADDLFDVLASASTAPSLEITLLRGADERTVTVSW
jgi:hypothetical protein